MISKGKEFAIRDSRDITEYKLQESNIIKESTIENIEYQLNQLKPLVTQNTNHSTIYYTLYYAIHYTESPLIIPPLLCLLHHHEKHVKQSGLNLLLLNPKIPSNYKIVFEIENWIKNMMALGTVLGWLFRLPFFMKIRKLKAVLHENYALLGSLSSQVGAS